MQAECGSDAGSIRVQVGKGGVVVGFSSPEPDPVEGEAESRAEAEIKVGGFDLAVDRGVWFKDSKCPLS